MKKNKLLVIVGPTSSGKSDLAVDLALNFNGEVISADSRQVYKGLDIATGKITPEEMKRVPHHLLNVADPQTQFSAGEYKKLADKALYDIHERNKLPILCGGTGFFIQSIVDDLIFPEVPPNEQLRTELKEKTQEELLTILESLDPHRAETIERENPRRLVRSIEIVHALGSVPPLIRNERFDTLQIGLRISEEELRERIHQRTLRRIEQGMIEETKKLYEEGLSFERMYELGLEYRHLADYLQQKISEDELISSIERDNWRYSRRQMVWFKKDSRIEWFEYNEREKVEERVKDWISS